MLQARRRDANEKPVVDALKAIGAVVARLNDFGVPDLLVGFRGRTILLEIKVPTTKAHSKKSKPGAGPSENAKGQLTDCQIKWWDTWIGGEAYVVETPEQAIALVQGSELPDTIGAVALKSGGVLVTVGPGSMSLLPEWADTLAGALHEQAGVARAISRELPQLTTKPK